MIVPQVQTTSIIARERPRASTPNQHRSEQLPITASPQAPRRNLQQQGAVGIGQQSKPTESVNKQQSSHLRVQPTHQKPHQPAAQEAFDFDPRQHEKPAQSYVTPFDAHQGSEEVDLFGQQPFSSANGKVRVPSRGSSHSPSPPVETDAFGCVPFTGGPRETLSKKNGPVPSKATSNKQVDRFGSEPFTDNVQVTTKSPVQVTSKSHKKTGSGSHQFVQQSSPTDQFGHTPFVVTENKLFKQSDSFHSTSSSAGSFSPPNQSSISASYSEDLLITNRR